MDLPNVFCLPIKEKKAERWHLIPGPSFGSGQYGTVYGACKRDKCSYVMKVVLFGKKTPESAFDKEVRIQTLIAGYDLTIPVEDSWKCKKPSLTGVIIMRALDITVKDFLVQPDITVNDADSIVAGCRKLIKTLHDLGYYHGDNHFANIMMKRIPSKESGPLSVKTTLGTYQLYLIDLGKAGELSDPGSIRGVAVTDKRRIKEDNVILEDEIRQVTARFHPESIESIII